MLFLRENCKLPLHSDLFVCSSVGLVYRFVLCLPLLLYFLFPPITSVACHLPFPYSTSQTLAVTKARYYDILGNDDTNIWYSVFLWKLWSDTYLDDVSKFIRQSVWLSKAKAWRCTRLCLKILSKVLTPSHFLLWPYPGSGSFLVTLSLSESPCCHTSYSCPWPICITMEEKHLRLH